MFLSFEATAAYIKSHLYEMIAAIFYCRTFHRSNYHFLALRHTSINF
jgi:hypothetical protein